MGTRSKYYNILNSTKNEHLEKKKLEASSQKSFS